MSGPRKKSPSAVRATSLCALLLLTLSCKLLNTEDDEGVLGRGARAFDPYQVDSGAIRLSLQMFNGCSVLPSGLAVQKGDIDFPIPNYPATCPNFFSGNPAGTLSAPTGRYELLRGGTYFLNQFTLADSVLSTDPLTGGKASPPPISDVIRWMKTQTRFAKLDWSNLARAGDEWIFNPGPPGVGRDVWQHELRLDNANWNQVKDDTFTLEFLDREGTPRGAPITYSRSEFLGESVHSGHSRMGVRIENILPPRYTGDDEPRPLPALQGYNPPFPPVTYRSIVRMDVVNNMTPGAKTFRVPEIEGDGAIRLTWSQLPDDPFYFPVKYLNSTDIAPTCYKDDGATVPCDFGLDPRLVLNAPANGQGFYEPGERLQIIMDIRDGKGNRLHTPNLLPSGADAAAGKTNGISYPILQ